MRKGPVKRELLEMFRITALWKKKRKTPSKAPVAALWNTFSAVQSWDFERTRLCITTSSKTELNLTCDIFLGAGEDVESPEVTASRPSLKVPITSAAPKVETTTLKIQNKMPAQTKVCSCLYCVIKES